MPSAGWNEACGQVFRYGVSTGRSERHPAVDLRGALKPVMTRHMSAILEPSQTGDLMRSIDGYQGQPFNSNGAVAVGIPVSAAGQHPTEGVG